MNQNKSRAISRRSFLKGAGIAGAASVLAACGSNSTAASGSSAEASAEGKVINIYSWNENSAPVWKLFILRSPAPRPMVPSPP